MQESARNPELEPNVDAYGTYARASAVADFLELLALNGTRLRRGAIADYIGDVQWGSRTDEIFLSPEDFVQGPDELGEGLGSDDDDAATRVFAVFGRRAECLGERYPFRVDIGEQTLEALDRSPSPYLALLGITIAHAFDVDTVLAPTEVFEDTVARALQRAGHMSLNFSRFRKQHTTFEKALVAAGPAINLRPTPQVAERSRFAQDGGCDVLAQVNSGYLPGCGPGAWALVGQVTCGQSDTWERKLGEVAAPAWRDRLAVVLPPQVFLAIPHHAERNHLASLVKGKEQMVLDRIRLTRMLTDVSSDEQMILDAVIAVPTAKVASS